VRKQLLVAVIHDECDGIYFVSRSTSHVYHVCVGLIGTDTSTM